MFSSCAISQWSMSRGKVFCQTLSVFSLLLLQWVESRNRYLISHPITRFQDIRQWEKSFFFFQSEKKKKWLWLRSSLGLIKDSFAKKRGKGKKGSHFEIIIFEMFPLAKKIVVVFLSYVEYTEDVLLEERRNLS